MGRTRVLVPPSGGCLSRVGRGHGTRGRGVLSRTGGRRCLPDQVLRPAGPPPVASPGPPPAETSQSGGQDPPHHRRFVTKQSNQQTPRKEKKTNWPDPASRPCPAPPRPSPPGVPAPARGSEREPGAPHPPPRARSLPARGGGGPDRAARPARAPPAPAAAPAPRRPRRVRAARAPARQALRARRPRRAGPGPPARASWLHTSGTGSNARSSSGRSATSECRTCKVTQPRLAPGSPGRALGEPGAQLRHLATPPRRPRSPAASCSCHLPWGERLGLDARPQAPGRPAPARFTVAQGVGRHTCVC